MVETLEQIKARIEAAVSGARLDIIPNGSPSGQRSLLIDGAHAVAVATSAVRDARNAAMCSDRNLAEFLAGEALVREDGNDG